MQKAFTLIFCLFIFSGLTGQHVADFEGFNLDPETYMNNADPADGFMSNGVFLPNTHMISGGFESWTGWSISNTTNLTDSTYANQYSVVNGVGAGGSSTYGVSFVAGESSMRNEVISTGSSTFESIMVNNTLLTHGIIERGNMFSKKFGGETGDDPDYFLLTIKGRSGGDLTTDSINFYLADYRFADNSEDYIITDWTKVDVSQFNSEDELVFTMSGSDVGMFGLNTPTYFCVDNITLMISSSTENLEDEIDLTVFPNPTTDFVNFDWNEGEGTAQIVNLQGSVLRNQVLQQGQNSINVSVLPEGIYTLKLETAEGFLAKQFVKQ